MLIGTASAATYHAGDTVTFSFSISSANGAAATVRMNVPSVFTFVSASGAKINPRNVGSGAGFIFGDGMTEFGSGSGSLTLKISDSAKPGNYTVSFYVADCYTVDFEKASCTVSGGGTITVVCEHSFGAYGETKKATCTEPGE